MSASLSTSEAEAIHDITQRFKHEVGAEALLDRSLGGFIEKIERFHNEINELRGEIGKVYAEARGIGFDISTVKQVVRERRDPTLSLPVGEHYKRAHTSANG